MNRHVQQAIAQVRVIRAFGMEDKEVENYRRTNQNHLETFHKEIIASTVSGTLAQWIELGTTVLIMYYGGSLALEDVPMLTLGELVSFTLYWNMMRSAFEIVWSMIGNLGQGAGPAGRVFSIIDNAPKIDPEAGIRLAQFGGGMVFDHVGFHYQTRPDSKVLRDVSFRIEKNKVTALVGKSGCGKTTIITMLLRFYEPVSGQITVDGIDLLSLNTRWLHQQVCEQVFFARAFLPFSSDCMGCSGHAAVLHNHRAKHCLRAGGLPAGGRGRGGKACAGARLHHDL
jgi:ABC-type multidrug transport system fused ATPase/permease subunit